MNGSVCTHSTSRNALSMTFKLNNMKGGLVVFSLFAKNTSLPPTVLFYFEIIFSLCRNLGFDRKENISYFGDRGNKLNISAGFAVQTDVCGLYF